MKDIHQQLDPKLMIGDKLRVQDQPGLTEI